MNTKGWDDQLSPEHEMADWAVVAIREWLQVSPLRNCLTRPLSLTWQVPILLLGPTTETELYCVDKL